MINAERQQRLLALIELADATFRLPERETQHEVYIRCGDVPELKCHMPPNPPKPWGKKARRQKRFS